VAELNALVASKTAELESLQDRHLKSQVVVMCFINHQLTKSTQTDNASLEKRLNATVVERDANKARADNISIALHV
jgi:hypothetical protein